MDVPLFWSSEDLRGQISSLYANMCLILSFLNSPAVFSSSTQVLENILYDQRLTSGPLDIVPRGGDWNRGSSGLALTMVPQYQHRHLPWDIVHWHPSVVQHQVQNGAKPQGGLWVVVGIVADHRCPTVWSCVSPFLTSDGACLRSCFFPFFTLALDYPADIRGALCMAQMYNLCPLSC